MHRLGSSQIHHAVRITAPSLWNASTASERATRSIKLSLIDRRKYHKTVLCFNQPEKDSSKGSNETSNAEEKKGGVKTSTSSETEDEVPKKKLTLKERFIANKPQMKKYAILSGIGACTYAILSSGLYLVELWEHMHYQDMGEAGFWTGVGTTLVMGGTVMLGSRAFVITPDAAYWHTLKKVTTDPKVLESLGKSAPGHFRAYSVIGGHPRVFADAASAYDRWDRFWHPKTVQLLFQLKGTKADGLVAAEVCIRAEEYDYQLLTVNNLTTNDRVVLEGHPGKKEWSGSLRLRSGDPKEDIEFFPSD
eukprot:g20352.t1